MSIFRKIPIKWVTHNLNEMQKHSLVIKKKDLYSKRNWDTTSTRVFITGFMIGACVTNLYYIDKKDFPRI
jgi:hypothetical protein